MPTYDGADPKECEKALANEIRSDGFCFKLAPTENVSSNQILKLTPIIASCIPKKYENTCS